MHRGTFQTIFYAVFSKPMVMVNDHNIIGNVTGIANRNFFRTSDRTIMVHEDFFANPASCFFGTLYVTRTCRHQK